MWMYNPDDLDEYYQTVAPKPEPRTYSLVFCTKCGCTYLDTCREHGEEFLEKRNLKP